MFLLASILLEPNRWKPGRPPSIRVSDWSARAAAAGFDGWELWENHYRLAEAGERQQLETGPLPVRVFNTYEVFDDPARPGLAEVAACARRLGAVGIKFNVGNDPARRGTYRATIEAFPTGARLLCECHPGTSLETPEAVSDFMGEETEWPFDLIIHPFLLSPEAITHWGRVLRGRIVHAHVQMRSGVDPRSFVSLADDAGRARECLAALAATGFSGIFSLEFAAPTNRVGETPEVLFASAMRDLEFLRKHWIPARYPASDP